MSTKKLYAGAGNAEFKFPPEYFPTFERYDRVMDPLHCKALLVEGEGRICILSMELPSLKPYTLIDEMKELVHDLTGYETENIWIGMTHNMAAPHVPEEDAGDGKYEIHVAAVRKAVTEAVLQAKETLLRVTFPVFSYFLDFVLIVDKTVIIRETVDEVRTLWADLFEDCRTPDFWYRLYSPKAQEPRRLHFRRPPSWKGARYGTKSSEF